MRIVAPIPGASQTEQKSGLSFKTQRHLAQHLTHHRLIGQILAERLTLQRMVQRHRVCAAHQGMAAGRAVEAGQRAHLENLPHAVALFAYQPPTGVKEFGFATGVRAVT